MRAAVGRAMLREAGGGLAIGGAVPDNVRDALPLILVAAVVGGVVVYVVARSAARRVDLALLGACVVAIVAMTQLRSGDLGPAANPLGPGGLRRAATWWAERPDLFPVLTSERFFNVVVFVPVGFFGQRVVDRWRHALAAVAVFSFVLECGQAATRSRVADAVDVALNTTGGAIGIGLALAVGRLPSPRVPR